MNKRKAHKAYAKVYIDRIDQVIIKQLDLKINSTALQEYEEFIYTNMLNNVQLGIGNYELTELAQ